MKPRTVPSPAPHAAGGRRQRRRLETKRRILEIALRLFAEQGFANTTVDAITEAADVGKGTFFNYFPTKEHLIVALGEKQLGKIEAAVQSIKPGAPVRELVRRIVHQLVAEWKNQRLLRSIVGTVLSSETMAQRFGALLAQGHINVAVLMQEGQRRGELRDDIPAVELARLLQQFMFGTQVIWSLHAFADLVARIDQALDVFWRGIEAGPATAPAVKGARRR